jgi:hypothetical protein
MKRKILCLLPALLLACSLSAAWAIPMAEVTYLENEVNGFWQYEFIVANTSNPVEDEGVNIYDLLLTFSEVPELSEIVNTQMPSGWEFTSDPGGDSVPGFIGLLSTIPGVFPDGTDIAPGTFLGGFVFQFDAELGDIFFAATLTNPGDVENPFVTPPGSATPVPEPATVAFLAVGLAGMGLFGRRMKIS